MEKKKECKLKTYIFASFYSSLHKLRLELTSYSYTLYFIFIHLSRTQSKSVPNLYNSNCACSGQDSFSLVQFSVKIWLTLVLPWFRLSLVLIQSTCYNLCLPTFLSLGYSDPNLMPQKKAKHRQYHKCTQEKTMGQINFVTSWYKNTYSILLLGFH